MRTVAWLAVALCGCASTSTNPPSTSEGDFDVVQAKQGGLDAPFMSIYIPAEHPQTGDAKEVADGLIDRVERLVEVIALPLGIENGAVSQKSRDYFSERRKARADFDGVGPTLPTGLRGAEDLPTLFAELQLRGYGDDDLERIASGNLLRVWAAIEAAAQNAAD